MKQYESKYGISVAELKRLLNEWPETNHKGVPTRVWLSLDEGLSSPCVKVKPLNPHSKTPDLLLE
jgi:hypothetical protein